MIEGLVGEAVVIAEDFRPLIQPLFLSPDNNTNRPKGVEGKGQIRTKYHNCMFLFQLRLLKRAVRCQQTGLTAKTAGFRG